MESWQKSNRGYAPANMFYAQYLASDALIFTDVLTSFGNRNAIAK